MYNGFMYNEGIESERHVSPPKSTNRTLPLAQEAPSMWSPQFPALLQSYYIILTYSSSLVDFFLFGWFFNIFCVFNWNTVSSTYLMGTIWQVLTMYVPLESLLQPREQICPSFSEKVSSCLAGVAQQLSIEPWTWRSLFSSSLGTCPGFQARSPVGGMPEAVD